LKPQNTLLYQFFIVEIEVDLKHVNDDNDVDLIEKGKNNGAQEIQIAGLRSNIEV
jgi:hypothetical protein